MAVGVAGRITMDCGALRHRASRRHRFGLALLHHSETKDDPRRKFGVVVLDSDVDALVEHAVNPRRSSWPGVTRKKEQKNVRVDNHLST